MTKMASSSCTLAALLLLAVWAGGAAARRQGVGSIITCSVFFDNMLKQRNDNACPARGFYTYEAFIAAANAFPAFGNTGSLATRKRELAAFFAQTSHETTGGTSGADDQFEWGYCSKEEQSKETEPPFYGRGPIKLSHRNSYEAAGRALGMDLANNPNLVANDPVVAFKTAIWYWMTPQSSNKPSCHDVMTGKWNPSGADCAAGRSPAGFGVITNIINGDQECGMGQKDSGEDRIGFYMRYCDMLDVDYGKNLDCYKQKKFE